jgi:hypothetical protein
MATANNGRTTLAAILMAAACASALGREPAFAEYRAVQESLSRVHPRMRASWLRERGLDDSPYTTFRKPDSGSGLSCIGRWSYGPAYDVDGRITPSETLIALARGSGVSLIRYNRSATPHVQLVSDINCSYLVTQVRLLDTLLFAGTRYGVELYNVANPTSPARLASIQTPLNAFDVRETLLCVAGPDTFSVYDISVPSAPLRLGHYLESGADVSIAGQAAYLADVGGLRVVDISNPVSPHRVGTWGGRVISVAARNTICCVTQDNANQPTWLRLSVLDASNPASIQTLSYIDSCGGYDTKLDDSLVFLSGYYTGGHEFRVIDIADSAHPVPLGRLATLSDNFGVWGSSAGRLATVADNFGGLVLVNAPTWTTPTQDSLCLRVGQAEDLCVTGGYCYIASDHAGLKVLDVNDPAQPLWVGDLDTASADVMNTSVAANDSFAFVCWWDPWLRAVNVSDPTRPVMTASLRTFGNPEDMVLRDSFLYVAEDYRFQIVNVARPRQPQVVGTCNMTAGYYWGMKLQDTLAYLGSWDGLTIVNVTRPDSPWVVSQTSSPHSRVSTEGVAVRDTFVFIPSYSETLWVYSVADPTAPYPIAGAPLGPGGWGYDADMLNDSTVIVGCKSYVKLVDVRDPAHPAVIGSYPTPNWVRRVVYTSPYIYAACADAGVMILETTAVAVAEPKRAPGWAGAGLHARPSPAGSRILVDFETVGIGPAEIAIIDMAGRIRLVRPAAGPQTAIEVSSLSPGVYAVTLRRDGLTVTGRFVKR